MKDLSNYEKDIRPWGQFERFTLNEQTTVKILTINPGEAFSLQTHASRKEFWRVLSGEGKVTVGEETSDALPGMEFFIPQGAVHRAHGGTTPLVMLEIAFGDFDENDITRLQDNYGRI